MYFWETAATPRTSLSCKVPNRIKAPPESNDRFGGIIGLQTLGFKKKVLSSKNEGAIGVV